MERETERGLYIYVCSTQAVISTEQQTHSLGFCHPLCLYLLTSVFGAERDRLDLKREANGLEALAQVPLLANW